MKNFIKGYVLKNKKIIIRLSMKDIPLTMDSYPKATKILRKNLPSIFRNKCFNPENLSFYRESKKTEIGHLFEHILIEYMCLIKIPYVDEVSFSGKTSWNAKKMTGHFRIEVSCALSDWPVFLKALQKSIDLMDLILISQENYYSGGQSALETAPSIN